MMNQGTYQPVGIQIGLGVKTAATKRIFTSGIAVNTDRNLDVMIEGEGFFAVQGLDGETYFTRNGSFNWALGTYGMITTANGKLPGRNRLCCERFCRYCWCW